MPAGYTVGCFNFQSDANNCGGCAKKCPPNAVCSNGACVCPTGYLNCGGTIGCAKTCGAAKGAPCVSNGQCASGVCANGICN